MPGSLARVCVRKCGFWGLFSLIRNIPRRTRPSSTQQLPAPSREPPGLPRAIVANRSSGVPGRPGPGTGGSSQTFLLRPRDRPPHWHTAVPHWQTANHTHAHTRTSSSSCCPLTLPPSHLQPIWAPPLTISVSCCGCVFDPSAHQDLLFDVAEVCTRGCAGLHQRYSLSLCPSFLSISLSPLSLSLPLLSLSLSLSIKHGAINNCFGCIGRVLEGG